MEERLAELAARLDEEVRGRKAVEKRLAAIEKENTAFRVALMGMLRSGVEATEKLVSGTVVGKPSVLERCSSPQEEGQVGDRDGGMRGYGVCQDKDEMYVQEAYTPPLTGQTLQSFSPERTPHRSADRGRDRRVRSSGPARNYDGRPHGHHRDGSPSRKHRGSFKHERSLSPDYKRDHPRSRRSRHSHDRRRSRSRSIRAGSRSRHKNERRSTSRHGRSGNGGYSPPNMDGPVRSRMHGRANGRSLGSRDDGGGGEARGWNVDDNTSHNVEVCRTEAQELDSNGWAIGVNNTGWSLADEAEAGWSSVEGTQGWNIIGPKDQEGGPVMPTSVNQIMTGGQPSSDDKVKQWKVAGAVGADSLATQDMEQDGLAKLPDLRAWDGEPASTGPDLNNKVLYDDDDDDDDDEGNLLGLLRSKDYRSEIASSVLFDSTGTKITVDRIGVLWRACGWVPPDSLPHYYKKQYGVPMMEEGAWKKMRAALCTMQGVTASEIRLGSEGDSTCKLLFKDDGHLKGRGVYSRLFVDVRVPEPVLYFYLVTTVMRPLEYHQGDVVMQLWASIQDKSPLDVCAVRTASDRTGRKGTDINQLWYNAIHWLRDLVQRGLTLGFKRIIEKVDEWSSYPGLGVNNTRDASNPEAKAVLGLRRSELRGLFYVTPILLKTILPEGDLLWLDQQLESI